MKGLPFFVVLRRSNVGDVGVGLSVRLRWGVGRILVPAFAGIRRGGVVLYGNKILRRGASSE